MLLVDGLVEGDREKRWVGFGLWDMWLGCVLSGGVFQGVVGKGKDLGGIILVVSIELFLCNLFLLLCLLLYVLCLEFV